MLSLLFSDKADLGWDTTIEAHYNGKERIYTIAIDGEEYISSTSDILVDVKAEEFYSTGTRILKVYEKSDTLKKNPYILKDYWPALVYGTEVETRSGILESISNKRMKKIVEKSLLTPKAFEDVKIGNFVDNTGKTILRGESPTKRRKLRLPKEKTSQKPGAEKRLAKGSAILTNGRSRRSPKNPRTSIYHRIHCRIVYEEVAIPYHELKNIEDMLLVLEHSLYGMFSTRSISFTI